MRRHPSKQTAIALAIAATASAGAQAAETNIQLYGIADASVRYLSTGPGYQPDNSRISMENGAITNSRWGLKGTEDLGNGNTAFFRLESGINLQNGSQSDPSRMFNRQSYVGLDGGEAGAISLGRQDTPLFTILGDTFDPLTVGNYEQNSWLPVAMSRGRTSDSVRYRNNKLGGFDLILSYAFGDSFDDHKLGQQYGGTLTYTTGPLTLGGGYQLTRADTNSDYTQRVWNLNVAYHLFDNTRLFAGYFNGRDETGFVNTVMGIADVPDNGLERKDNGYYAGVTWQPMATSWTFTGAAYFDTSKNVIQDGDKGKRYALVAVAEYALSKRTQLYGTVDFNRVYDASTAEIASGSTQLGVATGIRHIF
ncbi:porin [Bordetella bronchialis]|uniref:Porin n=1 Tax=Bordetella bronchialis TaxID=463025 RepID=A0A193FV56_9BORD|nr:porin [Bordetella bronchialis]ANN71642.1 porin [Bordetella bronchialis]